MRTVMNLLRSKRCDHCQCGACTVHVHGKRVVSCLNLALVHDGHEITTMIGSSKSVDYRTACARVLIDGMRIVSFIFHPAELTRIEEASSITNLRNIWAEPACIRCRHSRPGYVLKEFGTSQLD